MVTSQVMSCHGYDILRCRPHWYSLKEDSEVSHTSCSLFAQAVSVLVPEQSGLRLPCPTERRICLYTAWSCNEALCRARYHETRFLVVAQHRPTKSGMPSARSHCVVSQMCSPTLVPAEAAQFAQVKAAGLG